MEKIKTGNVNQLVTTENKSWIIGFSAQEPFRTDLFGLKWISYKKGDKREPSKPNAETLTILISGKFKNTFYDQDGKIIVDCIIEKQGDYIYFDKDIMHTWEALEDSLVIALRWPSR